jgi:hypothetical protein
MEGEKSCMARRERRTPGLYPAGAAMQGPKGPNRRENARPMTRLDIRDCMRLFRLPAMIVVIFPMLALAGTTPAPAAGVTLENLGVTVGATTYRMSRLTIEGGDPSAIAGVFLSGGAGIETRLAGLTAKRIVIPELLTETRAAGGVERARYRDVILTDVVDGRVAVAHATAAEQTIEQADGREARFDWRGLSFRGVDLRQLAHVVAPDAAPSATEPLKPVLDEEIIDSASYESQSGDVSVRAGRLTLVGAKARAFVRSAAPPDNGANQLARAAGDMAFDRFETQNLVIEGRVPGEAGAFSLRIERIDLRGLANGTLSAATLDHLSLSTPAGGTATLAEFGLRDASLATLVDGGLPQIGHASVSDVVADLPTPQTGPTSRLRFRLAGVHFDLENFRARIPTKFALGVDRLFIDLAAHGDAGLAAPLRALGYRAVDLSASAAGAWDEKTGDVVVAPVRVSTPEMGAATLAATFGNVSGLVFSSSTLVSRAAAAAASFKSLDLTLEGGGLVERLMAQQATASSSPTEKPRPDAAQTVRDALAQTIGGGPNARRVSDALADYLRAPQHLHVRLAGKPSINALDILARKPADIFEGLEVEATTQTGETAPPQSPPPQRAP